MFMKRTSLLTFAGAAALAMAASTAAEAFCPGGHGSFARAFSPVPQHRPAVKIAKKPTAPVRYSKATAPAASPVRPASVTKPTVVAKAPASVRIPNAATATSAAIPAKSAAESTSAPAAAATDTCLIKEYLATGAVKFRDTCSNEWAINSTKVTSKVATVGGACLTKETNSNGVVLFKDSCTNEWAMNTLEQMSLAQAK
jgi:hypothetical protein